MNQYVVLQSVLSAKLVGGGSLKSVPELERSINAQVSKGYRLHTLTTVSANGTGIAREGKVQVNLITPKSKGGHKEFSNMQAVCDSCNYMKHYLTNDEFFRKVFAVAIHNVRNIFKACLKGGASA